MECVSAAVMTVTDNTDDGRTCEGDRVMPDGSGCVCGAYSYAECGCPDADWSCGECARLTAALHEIMAECEGYTDERSHIWHIADRAIKPNPTVTAAA